MTGATLKAKRQSLSLSQESLAHELGVSVMTVSRWERGLHRIPKAISKALVALELQQGIGKAIDCRTRTGNDTTSDIIAVYKQSLN